MFTGPIPVCCSSPSSQALQFILLQLRRSHPSPDACRADQILQPSLFIVVWGLLHCW